MLAEVYCSVFCWTLSLSAVFIPAVFFVVSSVFFLANSRLPFLCLTSFFAAFSLSNFLPLHHLFFFLIQPPSTFSVLLLKYI